MYLSKVVSVALVMRLVFLGDLAQHLQLNIPGKGHGYDPKIPNLYWDCAIVFNYASLPIF